MSQILVGPRNVALLAEGVDRNNSLSSLNTGAGVALLAEGVDRNVLTSLFVCVVCTVALLAEGVDRNSQCLRCFGKVLESPSSRRAWIEIQSRQRLRIAIFVALLAEGVDRNRMFVLGAEKPPASPSSRRAWIEIPKIR